jgi:hypothetical protein
MLLLLEDSWMTMAITSPLMMYAENCVFEDLQ